MFHALEIIVIDQPNFTTDTLWISDKNSYIVLNINYLHNESQLEYNRDERPQDFSPTPMERNGGVSRVRFSPYI